MNKKLVALAVAGVLSAPLAAQAQTANVTLYGRLNITLEAVQTKISDGSKPNVYRVSSNSSRLGVRGTESLGGGLNAIFQIESNVSADTGNSTTSGFASRESFVGLQGAWGTFKMGYFLSPYDDIHPIFGNVPTLTTSILSTANLWAQGSLGADDVPMFVVGLLFSFASAWLCVRWLLRYISSHRFTPFAWYRIAFGIMVLATAWSGLVTWAE